MSFLVMLICIATGFFWSAGHEMRKFGWFQAYLARAGEFLAGQSGIQAILRYLIVWLPVPVLTWLILLLFNSFLFGALVFVLSSILLWYSLGPIPVDQDYNDYFAALHRHEEGKARDVATKLLGFEPPQGLAGLTRTVAAKMFVSAEQELFSVLFWFLLLGPAGALGYRLVIESQKFGNPEIMGVAAKIQLWLDYVPARLVSLSFSLMGHFIAVIGCLMNCLWSNPSVNATLVGDSGLAAIGAGMDETKELTINDHQEGIRLVYRTLMTWLVVVALMVLVHWVS
jgi:AmpE protein